MKRNIFVLAVLTLLLVALPIFISCANPTDDGGSDFTGYTNVDDTPQSIPALPPNVAVGGGTVNPPDLKIKPPTPQANGSSLIEATGDVDTSTFSSTDGFPNSVVQADMLPGGYTVSGNHSSMVIAGIVDPTKPGTIKQYNTAFNLLNALHPDSRIYEYGTAGVYKLKSYTGGPNSYYPEDLGGFDVLIAENAEIKIITLEVTQDGVTKTYVIDYRGVTF
jgi:hypothetical protein